MFEISKMITMSTGHIKKNTAKSLNIQNNDFLPVYNKAEYGWFIFVGSEDIEEDLSNLPEDLRKVVEFALKNECDWLCLDRDGEIVSDLPFYEW